ncbi:MAG: pentapeptide repeat-containing protein [Cyanobacteria bacterium P01_A01_bin.45]
MFFNLSINRSIIFSVIILLLTPIFLLVFLFSQPARSESINLTPLTLELLQERISNPIVRDGNFTVDLRHMQIDLQQENSLFNSQFYRLLRKELQKTGSQPLALDLSNSLILGDFLGNELGLRTPLYSQAIAPIFTLPEQKQLEDLRSVCLRSLISELPLSQDCSSLIISKPTVPGEINVFRGSLILIETHFVGKVDFSNSFFLQYLDLKGSIFEKESHWNEARFSRNVQFSEVDFQEITNFKGSIFFNKVRFRKSLFKKLANFQDVNFISTSDFSQATFQDTVDFRHGQWWSNGNFSKVRFFQTVIFTKANFDEFLFFTEAIFEKLVTFREAEFHQSVNLRNASILNQADFSDAEFNQSAYLYVPGLSFNSNLAKILGNPGEIGNRLFVPNLQGNTNVLRNLVQNFRQLQQIADANQLDYTKEKLLLKRDYQRLFSQNINKISLKSFIRLGFSETQAKSIIRYRHQNKFKNKRELLKIIDIDYLTYLHVSPQITVSENLSTFKWLILLLHWMGLILLLILTGFGTNFWLVIGVGMLATTYFGFIFWICDALSLRLYTSNKSQENKSQENYCRFKIQIILKKYETISMIISFILLNTISLTAIFRNSDNPCLTLACLFIILVPVPVVLLYKLYIQGHFEILREVSYFTEDGSMRQLRLLIGSLPIIPRYPMFRERFMPLLWERRWNWLNYYDFSLSNLLKIGFNDVRLRDKNLPGVISILAWYQWSLGILYITLLLWTLSRTIPGLNLLIYLK